MSNAFHTAARILRGGDEKTATAAIILAAGNSTRMGKGQNKQFLKTNCTLMKSNLKVNLYVKTI